MAPHNGRAVLIEKGEESAVERQQRQRAQQQQEDNGNDGSISDNNEQEDTGEDTDSAQGLPKGGLRWQSDRSSSRASSPCASRANSPVPSLTATCGSGEGDSEGGAGIAMAVEEAADAQALVEDTVKKGMNESKEAAADETPSANPNTNSGASKGKGKGKDKPDNKRKRKQEEEEEEEDTAKNNDDSSSAPGSPPGKLNEYQRQLRNAREKRRSGKICNQFDEIRDTMVKAGVIVPKGTKGTILAAAKEYITLLQEQQRRVALDNCLLVHQVQRIGEGALGASASNAVRQVAAKNGVSDIVWPGSPQNNPNNLNKENQQQQPKPNAKEAPDYAGAFRNSPVAMAVATLGGSFMDCNDQFCQATCLNKQQVTAQTIFTLIDQEELTNAFDRISQWLYAMNATAQQQQQQQAGQWSQQQPAPAQPPIVLKSNVKDITTCDQNKQLSLTPVKEKGALRYLCVTLTARPPDQQEDLLAAQGVPLSLTLSTNNNANNSSAPKAEQQQTSTSFYAVG